MPTFAFTVTEYDVERRWVVVSSERRTVELDDGVDFFEWAAVEWPAPRFSVQLDPWELARSRGL